MAMGRREKRRRQEGLWIAHTQLPRSAAHPFYEQLNQLLDANRFDEFVESHCKRFYATKMGRPSLPPGMYFRLLLLGYFEGLDSERGIAWRAADSLGLRRFLGIALDEDAPNHSTISRTRRLIDLETHQQVFFWVLQRVAQAGLLKGKTLGVDATTLEANAALRSIVRRDSGESYQDFLKKLAEASGIKTPSRRELAKLDRNHTGKGSNKLWVNPHDRDARIAKMKDGRTHLAHKAEHAVDMDTGAVVAVMLQDADQGDTQTGTETLATAGEQLANIIEHPQAGVQVHAQGVQEVVADKGYHSNGVLSSYKRHKCGLISPSLSVASVTGKGNGATVIVCTLIGGGSSATEARRCCVVAASCWSAPLPTCTKVAACAEPTCADIRTSSSAWWCMRAGSISASSCGSGWESASRASCRAG